jgi:hypothetical protein
MGSIAHPQTSVRNYDYTLAFPLKMGRIADLQKSLRNYEYSLAFPLKMGRTAHPQKSLRNYHYSLAFLTSEDGKDSSSSKVGKELPLLSGILDL